MGISISIILIIMATVACMNGITFWVREKHAGTIRYFLLLLSISVTCWCLGYGVMGLTEDFSKASIWQGIGFVGVVSYLVIMECFIDHLIDIPFKTRWMIQSVLIIYGILDFFFYENPNTHTFVRLPSRTAYMAEKTFGRYFHSVYVLVSFVYLFTVALIWYKQSDFARQSKFVKNAILANFFVIACAIPDTLLPMFNQASFPSSGIGGFAAFICIWNAAFSENAFAITVKNISDYIYESVNAAILVFDPKQVLSMTNEYALSFLRINRNKDFDLRDIFNITLNEEKMIFSVALERGSYTKKLRTKKGDISCSFNISAVNDDNGDPYCFICFVYDLSQEESLLREMVAANHAKSVFLANMSHEIRTPINAVLGMNELIMRESKDETISSYAADIDSAGRNLLTIINDVLDFSKIESGKLEIIPVEYDVASIINDSYNMITLRAKAKNLTVNVSCDEKMPSRLLGDEVRVRQILVNLLTNAVKYTEKGSVDVSVSWKPEGEISKDKATNGGVKTGKLILKVSDTGIGISGENMETLFNSFRRLEERKNRTIEGTGLGLTITKQLIDLMDGTVQVESVYGEGSAFTVILPQTVVDEKPMGNLRQKYQNSETHEYKEQFHAKDAKVLVVDDVKMNLVVFKGLLKKTLIEVDMATSGKEALEKIKENAYDIIFMDHMMPEMDGIETYNAMKTMEHKNENTPVIMLTANAIVGAEQEYKNIGFVDYLSKPVQATNLEAMILKYLPDDKVE